MNNSAVSNVNIHLKHQKIFQELNVYKYLSKAISNTWSLSRTKASFYKEEL